MDRAYISNHNFPPFDYIVRGKPPCSPGENGRIISFHPEHFQCKDKLYQANRSRLKIISQNPSGISYESFLILGTTKLL